MSFTYVTTNDIGKIRMLINDRVEPAAFSDEELTAILAVADGIVYGAAGTALRTIAASKAMLGKRIQAGHYSEDTTAVAEMLLKVADAYDERAEAIALLAAEAPAEADSELGVTDFGMTSFLVNEVLRGTL